jgi:hypothetical protein
MNSIDGFGSMMGISGSSRQAVSLTDDQKKQVQTILSKYDPKSLTAQDAQDIFKQLKDAGIKPGKDLRETMKAAGFDMHALRSMAFNAVQSDQNSTQGATLTDDQKKQVADILSKYDPKALTAADAQSIFKQLKDAGIQPGKDLKDTIQAAGFNTEQLASLAAPKGGHHHHHSEGTQASSQTSGINTSALQSLQSILDQYDLKNLSTDQQKSLMTQLDQAGLLQSGETINLSA